jgi:hypothetical protein
MKRFYTRIPSRRGKGWVLGSEIIQSELKLKRQNYILLLITVLVAVFFLLRDKTPFGKANTSFAVSPGSEITRIEFEQGKERLVLEKKGEEWLLNGRLNTRKSSISFINRILHEMRIKSPVSQQLLDSAVTESHPVEVKVYHDRKRLSSFHVYKTTTNVYGNIMKMGERSKPFIVYVPGHDGDIGSAFTLNELYWQPYTIFNMLPSEIAEVRLENFSDTAASFIIARQNSRYILQNAGNSWDSTLVRRYLTYFTFIPFETWALRLSETEKNDIRTSDPTFRITVTTIKGGRVELVLWERKNPDGSTDTDRMYGTTGQTREIFIVRYFDIDPVLKKRDYFIN